MIKIGELITHLLTFTDITDVVGNRIYYGVPNDEPSDIYVTINGITGSQLSEVEVRQRLEFRIIGNATSSLAELQELSDKILNHTRAFNKGYRFVLSNFANGYDEKKRKIFLQDVIINNTI